MAAQGGLRDGGKGAGMLGIPQHQLHWPAPLPSSQQHPQGNAGQWDLQPKQLRCLPHGRRMVVPVGEGTGHAWIGMMR